MRRLINTNQLSANQVGGLRSDFSSFVDSFLDRYGEQAGAVSNLEEFVTDTSYQPTLEPTNLAVRSVALEEPPVELVDESPFDHELDLPLSGSPVIELWSEVELAGVTIPAGEIDLSTGDFSRAVYVFGRVSRTLWWLAYYVGVATLLRREFVYYTSLGSTEGAA